MSTSLHRAGSSVSSSPHTLLWGKPIRRPSGAFEGLSPLQGMNLTCFRFDAPRWEPVSKAIASVQWLPEAIRAGIVAMVKATSSSRR
jgi:hypothetical protein